MVVVIKIMVFWDMVPFTLIEMYNVSEKPTATISRSEEYCEDTGNRFL
jgi:hypothetical protein